MVRITVFFETLREIFDTSAELQRDFEYHSHRCDGFDDEECIAANEKYMNGLTVYMEHIKTITNAVKAGNVEKMTIDEVRWLESHLYSTTHYDYYHMKTVPTIDELIDAIADKQLINIGEYSAAGLRRFKVKLMNGSKEIPDVSNVKKIGVDAFMELNAVSDNPKKYLEMLLDANEVELLGSVFSKVDFDDITTEYLLTELKNRNLIQPFIKSLTSDGKDKLMSIMFVKIF